MDNSDDERFVARRGSQGDEWRWDAPSSRSEHSGARRSGRLKRWLASPAEAERTDSETATEEASAAMALRRPMSLVVVAGAVSLGLAVILGIIVGVSAIDGGDDTLVAALGSRTPNPTLIPAVSQSPRPTESATPVATQAPSPVPVPPPPQGAVSLALWANGAAAWWFGTVDATVAAFREGQAVPLLVQWDANPAQSYRVHLTYDCSKDGAAGAIDFISGAQDWGSVVLNAENGPGNKQPSGNIPTRDTPGFAADDGNGGRFWLYGAVFSAWADEPAPGGACTGQRTIYLPVYATSTKVTLLASAHLGPSSIHGTGASAATTPIAASVSVEGLGEASVAIDPSAIAGD